MSKQTDTRYRIMESAIELFSTRGYMAATTKEIATRAQVNELTLFRHFGSKDALLDRSIDHAFAYEELQASLPPLTGDPEEDLLSTVAFMRGNMRQRASLYRLMLKEFSNNTVVREKLKELPRKVKAVMLERMGYILRPNMRTGTDIETASIFLMSYFLRSEMMVIMMGEDPFHEVDESRTREVVRMFLNGVMGEGPR
ncbi:MAG: TetR/AcrR family transcriptional regulator [Candidatus Thermoplasmatota archaeon]|nr:TetR/AcrR family transcriptional regulator [Candidatus Thermoplasmatota archaeon]